MTINNNNYYIMMADIIKSRYQDQARLSDSFSNLVKNINHERKRIILSPLTITLGDEFQAVFNKLSDAAEVIIALEEKKILTDSRFSLRYVIVEGTIDTPINKKIAYGMMGEGLTNARKILGELKEKDHHYNVVLKDMDKGRVLTQAFTIFDEIKSEWKWGKDIPYAASFIKEDDYKKVSEELGKDRAQMWRKRKSLKIDQYIAIKSVIKYLTCSE
jgi:small nuclear ribonucleoprotein (snRNP)-like protein